MPVGRFARLWGLVGLLVLGYPRQVLATDARLATCVSVLGAGARTVELQRLIENEVDRHTTHRATRKTCQAFLSVELIDLGKDGRWLTGRINSQVPHREAITGAGLASAVERLLTVVLHNDPLRLHGPRRENWLDQKFNALRYRSTLHFGLELAELGAVLDHRLQTLPSAALSARREVDDFHVGFRLQGAYTPARSHRLLLTTVIEAELDASWYAATIANTSLFSSILFGLGHQRFEGPARDSPDEIAVASSSGAVVGLRAGVETLRVTDLRLTVFCQAVLPTFQIHSDDAEIAAAWVPWASLGAGVSF